MDTSTKIEMKILNDLYSSDNQTITNQYSAYYESIDDNQSKNVVKPILERIVEQGGVKCEYGQNEFVLSVQ